MDDDLEACCVAARDAYVKRIADAIVSYPWIKTFPCPHCRRIVKVRLYGPPQEVGEGA
ncbi:MAG TPA: hypothetical protein VMW17_02900 [Candidatus Binatia bacterium]|nr:hypothetical protein [Candidatus Binatia bacterium]